MSAGDGRLGRARAAGGAAAPETGVVTLPVRHCALPPPGTLSRGLARPGPLLQLSDGRSPELLPSPLHSKRGPSPRARHSLPLPSGHFPSRCLFQLKVTSVKDLESHCVLLSFSPTAHRHRGGAHHVRGPKISLEKSIWLLTGA